jgi:nucleoside-diphosphate-sugar epimerase
VRGILKILGSGDAMPYNLGNPEEVTVLELANLIRRLTGTGSPIEFRPLPEDDPKQRRPDITRAQSELGWQPEVQLEAGLERTLAYFRKALVA